jgi:hypothetical protein
VVFRKLFISAVIAAFAARADAVILLNSATRNTSPPTGELADAGWQFQGQFSGFLATPISSKYFITAQHIGGSAPGGAIFYNGQNYVTDQSIDIPGTDLRMWRISATFPTWAPIYNRATDGPEAGRRMFVVGRGTQRGDAVYVDEPLGEPVVNDGPFGQRAFPPQPVLKGWRWGLEDRIQSWGENVVSEVFDDQDFGDLLYFTFDRDGLANEAHLSSGDSGGGVFIEVGSTWKLAGINLSVDGPFRQSPTDAEFLGAIFDAGGLYFGSSPQLIPNTLADIPSGAYASSIAGSLSFINAQIATAASTADVPEPANALVLLAAVNLLRRPRGA